METYEIGLQHYINVDVKKGELPKKLIAALRIMVMNEEELNNPKDVYKMMNRRNEIEMLNIFINLLEELLQQYPTTLEEDIHILKNKNLSINMYYSVLYRKSQKEIIYNAITNAKNLMNIINY